VSRTHEAWGHRARKRVGPSPPRPIGYSDMNCSTRPIDNKPVQKIVDAYSALGKGIG